MSDHLYTVTVHMVTEPVEFTYDARELDLPLNASAEQAVSHVQEKLLEGLDELLPFPDKLWISVEREDGDVVAHVVHGVTGVELGVGVVVVPPAAAAMATLPSVCVSIALVMVLAAT